MPHFGLGFRSQHFADLVAAPRGIDWLEVLSDNHLGVGGPRRAQLETLRARTPVALHGVGLGIANDTPPSGAYLAALRDLADFVQPLFVSDHLCWTGLAGVTSHDLLPVPAFRSLLGALSDRIARVQDALGRRLLLENATAYVRFRGEDATEAELLAALCERTGCGVVLDVNNLFVNAANLGSDPDAALAALAPHDVAYFHVAGHAQLPDVRVDTHGAAVPGAVWALFRRAARRFPHAHVVLERDDAIPPLADLVAELDLAREHWARAQAEPDPDAPLRVALAHARSEVRVPWPEAQRAFWDALAEGAASETLAAALDAAAPVTAERGLRVYRDAFATLAERVLAANFPTLARALGRRDFAALCAAFVRAHPPRSHDFVRFGAPLADFVARFELAEAYCVPRAALADIARLEQAQREAQEAPDAPASAPIEAILALAPGDWERARFRFAPSLRGLSLGWDVLPALRAVTAGETLPLPERGACGVLVVRAAGGVRSERIEPAGALALAALARGARFAEACEAAGGEEAAASAARALALAASAGALCAIEA